MGVQFIHYMLLLAVTEEDLSPYSHDLMVQVDGKTKMTERKYGGTFKDRNNYVVHGQTLQYYLQKGLKMKKVHRVMAFHQKSFVAPYIHKCIEARKNSRSKSFGDFCKLLANRYFS